MNKLFMFIAGAMALGTMASCSDNEKIEGYWTSSSSIDVASKVEGAQSADAEFSMNFLEGKDKSEGPVALLSDIKVRKSVETDNAGSGLIVEYVASATLNTTWFRDVDDPDDYVITIEPEKIIIGIDNGTVAYPTADNALWTKERLDSLTAARIPIWTEETKQAANYLFSKFSVIDDVELSHNGKVLNLETKNPKTEYVFTKSEK